MYGDVIIFVTIFVLLLICGLCIIFSIRNNTNYANLSSAVPFGVYNFLYFQPVTGNYERFLARVIKIRKFTKEEIKKLDVTSSYRWFDDNFKRSETLVTCQLSDGSFRNFYAERTTLCRRTLIGELLYMLGRGRMA